MTVKDLSYATINSINHLYLIINKINGYIEERNGNKYLTLVSTDESKNTLKNMKIYEEKTKILLDRQLTTQAFMMKNIGKSTTIQVMIYL